MHLQQESPTGPMHLSHFMRLVSAYEPHPEKVEELAQALRDGLAEAEESMKVVVVDQDCVEHVFHCTPAGYVCLYRQVERYRVVEPD